MKPLSQNIKNKIAEEIGRGLSSRAIAESLGLSKSDINNIRKSLPHAVKSPSPGAKPKLTDRDKRAAKLSSEAGRAKNAVQVTKELNKTLDRPVEANTVRRALKEMDLQTVKIKPKPLLTARHRKARLQWARDKRDWTSHDWRRVIWSDETKINRLNSDGLQYAWVERSQVSSGASRPTLKYGGGSLMAWGCLTWGGVGRLAKIEGRMDRHQFIRILEDNLVPTLDALSLMPDMPAQQDLIFQQDNDPKHTSKDAQAWFGGRNISLLSWPAQSPDLNPIENLWSLLKRKIGERPEAPKGILELWSVVQEEWSKINLGYCRALIDSMPNRCKAVIRARGGPTKY